MVRRNIRLQNLDAAPGRVIRIGKAVDRPTRRIGGRQDIQLPGGIVNVAHPARATRPAHERAAGIVIAERGAADIGSRQPLEPISGVMRVGRTPAIGIARRNAPVGGVIDIADALAQRLIDQRAAALGVVGRRGAAERVVEQTRWPVAS